MTKVEIGKMVDYGTLEKALRSAAEKLGWKIDVKDKYRKGYVLGSVKEIRRYSYTSFELSRRF